ncbi:LLM class oxidoreductase [Priestia aryabhattai]|uniref:LLM class oxidoreductase n=1 Tax=Priestia aryabhattai TaxID=412384 RepID=UPI003981C0B6
MEKFNSHNGFVRTFKEDKLTLGLFLPLEAYSGSFPKMDLEEQMILAKKAEDLGFASLFARDAPLYDPTFGEVGFLYDPMMFLSYIAAHTDKIALGTSSIVTTLRHPLHLAKSAASLDKISNQRFLFGVATGDRQIEFPAFKVDHNERGELFRESIKVMKKVWKESFPQIHTKRIEMIQGDIVPKPVLSDIPVFGTGYASQPIEWLATHTDGWLFYPQDITRQRELIKNWKEASGGFKPFIQPLALDLSEKANEAPKPIPIGFRAGYKFLIDYLYAYQDAGVNHIIINLKDSKRPAKDVIQEIGEYVLPHFHSIC